MKLQETLSLNVRSLLIASALLLLGGSISPCWAWGRGGYRGGGFGVVVAPGAYWGAYDPYYYSPYYYPPYAYPYGAPPPNYSGYAPAASAGAPPQAVQSAPEVAAYDLKGFEEQIAKARESVNFQYSDGDISKVQLQKAGLNIDLIEKEARTEAAAAGGYLTRSQQDALLRSLWTGQAPAPAAAQLPPSAPPLAEAAPPSAPVSAPQALKASGGVPAGENLTLVTDQIVRLRRLLDGKLAHGDVTKAQHDGEASYLAQFETMARAQASGSGDDLTLDQENSLLMQLLRVQKTIQQNFIVN
jgi:hypothetical protein